MEVTIMRSGRTQARDRYKLLIPSTVIGSVAMEFTPEDWAKLSATELPRGGRLTTNVELVVRTWEAWIEELAESLDPAARAEFRGIEQDMLRRSMEKCSMTKYPPVSGDPNGERVCGEMICEVCGQEYFDHPFDWRVIGYGNVPFLNVLCDGRRVKL